MLDLLGVADLENCLGGVFFGVVREKHLSGEVLVRVRKEALDGVGNVALAAQRVDSEQAGRDVDEGDEVVNRQPLGAKRRGELLEVRLAAAGGLSPLVHSLQCVHVHVLVHLLCISVTCSLQP